MESTAVGIGVPLDDVDTAVNEDPAEAFEAVGNGGFEVGGLQVPLLGMVDLGIVDLGIVDLGIVGLEGDGGGGSRHC